MSFQQLLSLKKESLIIGENQKHDKTEIEFVLIEQSMLQRIHSYFVSGCLQYTQIIILDRIEKRLWTTKVVMAYSQWS